MMCSSFILKKWYRLGTYWSSYTPRHKFRPRINYLRELFVVGSYFGPAYNSNRRFLFENMV